MLEYNVYISEMFHGKTIETYNIFEHYSFLKRCRDAAKNIEDKDEFLEEVKSALMYYYWSKCEWELIMTPWPPHETDEGSKINVYSQVMLNWNIFSEYIWSKKDELKKLRMKRI